MTRSKDLEIEEIVATPLSQLSIPFSEADYFELFYRLDRLEELIEQIRELSYESEDTRSAALGAARKARDTIKRYTHAEEMRAAATTARGISLGQQQQQLILDSIVSRETDPQALPRRPGKRGIKAAIKQTLRQEHKNIFRSDYAFDAAWKALRKNGVIKDA